MPVSRKLKTGSLILGTFVGLLALIVYLAVRQTLTPQQAGVAAAAVFGLYIGFGILIATYRLVRRLD